MRYNIKTPREILEIKQGDEIIVKSGKRMFIVRGTRDGMQIFSKNYTSEKAENIYAGTTRGIVKGTAFSVGYGKDIVVKDIPTLYLI